MNARELCRKLTDNTAFSEHVKYMKYINIVHNNNHAPTDLFFFFFGTFSEGYGLTTTAGRLTLPSHHSKTAPGRGCAYSGTTWIYNPFHKCFETNTVNRVSICLSIYLPTYLSIYLSIYPSTNLTIYLSIYPSIQHPINLSICPSLCPCTFLLNLLNVLIDLSV